jgi:hypothetical protein
VSEPFYITEIIAGCLAGWPASHIQARKHTSQPSPSSRTLHGAPRRKASLRERSRVSAHAHLSHEKRQDKRADNRTFHIIRGQAVMSGLSLGTVKKVIRV